MNRKLTILLLGVLIILTASIIIYNRVEQDKGNLITVAVDDSLNLDKVFIEEGLFSSSSGSDQNLVKLGLEKVVFFKKPSNGFETICGENDFYLIYDNTYYTVFRHFIPNDFYDGIPKPHEYNFKLSKVGEKIIVKVNIIGPDGITYQKQLANIAEANENLWGRPTKASFVD